MTAALIRGNTVEAGVVAGRSTSKSQETAINTQQRHQKLQKIVSISQQFKTRIFIH
jgi:hypothetical protein